MLVAFKIFLRSILLPPTGLLLFGLCGASLLRSRPRAGRAMVSIALLSLWVLATPTIGFAIYRLAESYPAIRLPPPPDAGAIVILGGGGDRLASPEWGGDTMMDYGWERIVYGAALARRSGLPILVTSEVPDAQSMRAALQTAFGVEVRWFDSRSGDTFENARHAADILRGAGIRRVLLVTHSTHMRRAVEEFEAAGLDVVPAPVVVDPHPQPGLYAWLPELQSLLYARMGIYELLGRPVSAALRRWRGA